MTQVHQGSARGEGPGMPRVALLTAVVVSTAGVMLLAFQLREILAVVALGIVVSVTCAPIANYLARWRIPRALGVLGIYAVLGTLFGLFLWYAIPEAIHEIDRLFGEGDEFQERYAEIADTYNLPPLSEVGEYLEPLARNLAPTAARQALAAVTGLLYLVTILVVALLFTTVQVSTHELLISLTSPRHRQRAEEVTKILGRRVRGFVIGEVISMTIVGVVTYVGLVILGVPFPFLLAGLAFILELLPVLGPWLAGIPAVTLALTVSPELAITVAFFYFVLQQVESNVVIPLVQRHQTEVPAVVVLVAVLLGAASMGILGALIALPLAIVIHTLVTEVVVPWRTQQCTAELQDHPTSRPAVTPPV